MKQTLKFEDWNQSLEALVTELNKTGDGGFKTNQNGYSRIKDIVFITSGVMSTITVKEWGTDGLWAKERAGCKAVTFSHGYSRYSEIKRITSPEQMMEKDFINKLAEIMVEDTNRQLWANIDCEKQRTRKLRMNGENWMNFLKSVGTIDERALRFGSLYGHVMMKPTMKTVIDVKQPTDTNKDVFRQDVQITIDKVKGSIVTDHRDTDKDLRAKIQKILDSGVEITGIGINVIGTANQMTGLIKSLGSSQELIIA